MNLPDAAHIIVNIQGQSKKEALTELCGLFQDIDQKQLVKLLLDRETLGSTAIASGVALPHAKLDTLDETLIAVGWSKTGLHWNARDGKPVQLIILMVAPLSSSTSYLKNLANLSRFLKNSSNYTLLQKAQDAKDIQHILQSSRDFTL